MKFDVPYVHSLVPFGHQQSYLYLPQALWNLMYINFVLNFEARIFFSFVENLEKLKSARKWTSDTI